MKPIAYINVEKRTLEFAEPIKWHTPTVANLDRIPLFTKEALAQTQEPVAKVIDWGVEGPRLQGLTNDWPVVGTLLYTTPPQRTWVGLTDEERNEIANKTFGREGALTLYTEAIEAKLKEKNT
tara:strand:- start:906 stop:1274 length:369 start_codon:yes stop_codon:yes gene_type:complete